MLQILIDVADVMTPEMRLSLLIQNNDHYEQLKQLTKILEHGQSGKVNHNHFEISTIESLKVDAAENIRSKRQINDIQKGALANMNAFYFDEFTKPQFAVQEGFQEQHETLQTCIIDLTDTFHNLQDQQV